VHTDFQELERLLVEFERELEAALHHCHHHGHDPRPASVHVTHQGDTMGTYAPGTPIDFAAAADNAEQQPVTTQFSWATTAGTITPAADTLTAVLTDAPLGETTVTATAANGVAGSDTVTVADQTVATVTVTDTAAA